MLFYIFLISFTILIILLKSYSANSDTHLSATKAFYSKGIKSENHSLSLHSCFTLSSAHIKRADAPAIWCFLSYASFLPR